MHNYEIHIERGRKPTIRISDGWPKVTGPALIGTWIYIVQYIDVCNVSIKFSAYANSRSRSILFFFKFTIENNSLTFSMCMYNGILQYSELSECMRMITRGVSPATFICRLKKDARTFTHTINKAAQFFVKVLLSILFWWLDFAYSLTKNAHRYHSHLFIALKKCNASI